MKPLIAHPAFPGPNGSEPAQNTDRLERRPVAGLGRSDHVSRRSAGARRSQAAFSLLEVMIAGGLFFVAIFAILSLVAGTLRNARSLRAVDVDAGMVASQICNTNKLSEETRQGDFGNLYPDYSWEAEISQAETNNLFQVNILVRRRGVQKPVDVMSIFVYAPDSPQSGGFGRPTFR